MTREHILPLGLGGNLLFLKASCRSCADIINEEVETPILKAMFGPLRARLDLHERRRRGPKKQRSDKQLMKRVRQHGPDQPPYETKIVEVANADIPMMPIGFILEPPTLLSGASHDDTTIEMWAKIETDAYRKLVTSDGEGFQMARVKPLVFFRMLAKIAHGYAAAQLGLCNFAPLLPDFILGRSTAYSHLIGGPGRILEPDREGVHRLLRRIATSSVDGKRYHAVNIRLFLPFDPPEYDILVGECR